MFLKSLRWIAHDLVKLLFVDKTLHEEPIYPWEDTLSLAGSTLILELSLSDMKIILVCINVYYRNGDLLEIDNN